MTYHKSLKLRNIPIPFVVFIADTFLRLQLLEDCVLELYPSLPISWELSVRELVSYWLSQLSISTLKSS